jgi:hypothetical protein
MRLSELEVRICKAGSDAGVILKYFVDTNVAVDCLPAFYPTLRWRTFISGPSRIIDAILRGSQRG